MSFEITSREEAIYILSLLKQRAKKFVPVIDDNFPKQAAFIRDPSFRKAAQCSRRAGKSNAVGRAMFKEALDYPGCSTLYLALTRQSAKNIMWKDVIKTINKELNLGGTPNEAELVFKLPNGSQLMFAGADASRQEMEKYLGGKYRCVIVDEAGSFRQDLKKLIYENLEPAVSDYDGWVGMIGTPTEITNGLFYEVTTGTETSGWSVHKWETTDNPYMREKWLKRIDILLNDNPRVIETPAFRRMYKNEWVIDNESLVYRYKSGVNDCDQIPDDADFHVLGIDLGYNDATAFTLCCYGEFDKTLYFKHVYKKSGMIISDVAERIKWYINKYSPVALVIDGASKQSVEELKQRFELPLIAADKTGKSEFIEIMNSEFQQGLIKILQPDCSELSTEYLSLIWDKNAAKRVEHPNCENHAADAALYAWRHTYQYLAQKKPTPLSDAEKIDQWFDEQADKQKQDEHKSFWERL